MCLLDKDLTEVKFKEQGTESPHFSEVSHHPDRMCHLLPHNCYLEIKISGSEATFNIKTHKLQPSSLDDEKNVEML